MKPEFKVSVDDQLVAHCRQILSMGLTVAEWEQIESDDMFQSENYSGGYDADDRAFLFSYYQSNGQELWFALSLVDVGRVARGELLELNARIAES